MPVAKIPFNSKCGNSFQFKMWLLKTSPLLKIGCYYVIVTFTSFFGENCFSAGEGLNNWLKCVRVKQMKL